MSVVPDREAAARAQLVRLAKAAKEESERELDELAWFVPGQFAEFGVSDEADEFIAAASPDAVLALSERLVVLERERDEALESNEALKAHRATIQGVVGRAERAEVRLREIARLSEECDGTDHARILREIDAVLDEAC